MRARLKPWLTVLGLAVFCVLVLAVLYWYRSRMEWTPANMASYLPRANATIAYVDLNKLRESGLFDLIAGSKAMEELDYRTFVDATGFEYRSDLDRMAIAFQGDNRFVIARGNFDWKKINQYLVAAGGACHNSVCNYQSSQVTQHSVSYMPIRPSVIGLYSGSTELGVYDLSPRPIADSATEFPDAPFWVSVPASQWSTATELPAGSRAFASVFAESERVVFSVNGDSSGKLKLYADVLCANSTAAGKIHSRLAEATDLLRKMMAREKETPNSKDLSGLLAGGTFTVDGTNVKCTWPLERAFIEELISGNIAK